LLGQFDKINEDKRKLIVVVSEFICVKLGHIKTFVIYFLAAAERGVEAIAHVNGVIPTLSDIVQHSQLPLTSPDRKRSVTSAPEITRT